MDFLSPDSLAWFLAEAPAAAKKGFLSGTVIVMVVGLLLVVGGIYWYRSRGAK
jgi:hypothetical protein